MKPSASNKITVFIVEDENQSADLLQKKLEHYVPNISIIGVSHDILNAYKNISFLKPQVVFLDIHLGSQTGFDLLDLFQSIFFETIILTADNQFGIKAVKYQSLDYLLKPIKGTDLIHAMEKVRKKISPPLEQTLPTNTSFKFPIISGSRFDLIDLSSILYIEAEGNYSWLYLSSGKKICSTENIKQIQDKLLHQYFFRIHRSYIVNISKVQSFMNKKDKNYVILEDNKKLPVSESRKKDFMEIINSVYPKK